MDFFKNKYSGQVKLYAQALSEILDIEVGNLYIYSFEL